MKLTLLLSLAVLALSVYAEPGDKGVIQQAEGGRRLTLEQIATMPAADRAKLAQTSIFGSVMILAVKPDPKTPDLFAVLGVDMSGKKAPSGARGHWTNNRWVQVRCILRVDEDSALRLHKGDERNIAGVIDAVVVEPETKDTFEVVNLYLKNAKMR